MWRGGVALRLNLGTGETSSPGSGDVAWRRGLCLNLGTGETSSPGCGDVERRRGSASKKWTSRGANPLRPRRACLAGNGSRIRCRVGANARAPGELVSPVSGLGPDVTRRDVSPPASLPRR